MVPVCSGCGLRPKTKMSTVYWSWRTRTNERVAFKQRFEPTCFGDTYGLLRQQRAGQQSRCAMCGIELVEASTVFWATVYVPHRERWDLAVEACLDCTDELAERFSAKAERLPDRGAGEGGPLSQPPRPDPWASLDDLSLDPT